MVSYEIALGHVHDSGAAAGRGRIPEHDRAATGGGAAGTCSRSPSRASFSSSPRSPRRIGLPFDLPEAESELIAGYHTEYSAMKFSLFFIAEYANMVTASALIVTLFFGGWTVPFWHAVNTPPWAAWKTRDHAWRVPARRCCSSSSSTCGSAGRCRDFATTSSCPWAGRRYAAAGARLRRRHRRGDAGSGRAGRAAYASLWVAGLRSLPVGAERAWSWSSCSSSSIAVDSSVRRVPGCEPRLSWLRAVRARSARPCAMASAQAASADGVSTGGAWRAGPGPSGSVSVGCRSR